VIERRFSVVDPTVQVRIRSGHVTVETGEPGEVVVAVDTNDPTFDVRQRGDVIIASGDRGGRAYVTVNVPVGANLDLSSASGELRIAPALDRLDVSSASGGLTFDAVRRLQVKTASGDVRGNSVDGEARCVTASGSLSFSRLADRADLSTASGDITIGQASGDLSFASISGDIRIDRLDGPSLSAKSMSGNVRVGIPPRTRLDLDANSLSGRIRLPAPNPNPEPPDREMNVKVRLVSGDLRIDRVD
jgi:DUF4097 and DUF4098 domain-containing protein YvlB